MMSSACLPHIFKEDEMRIFVKSKNTIVSGKGLFNWILGIRGKDFQATQVRCLTAATAAVTLAFLFVEMLCYVLGRLHSSCVLCTKIGLHR